MYTNKTFSLSGVNVMINIFDDFDQLFVWKNWRFLENQYDYQSTFFISHLTAGLRVKIAFFVIRRCRTH
jgi:hypothetical protein